MAGRMADVHACTVPHRCTVGSGLSVDPRLKLKQARRAHGQSTLTLDMPFAVFFLIIPFHGLNIKLG